MKLPKCAEYMEETSEGRCLLVEMTKSGHRRLKALGTQAVQHSNGLKTDNFGGEAELRTLVGPHMPGNSVRKCGESCQKGLRRLKRP